MTEIVRIDAKVIVFDMDDTLYLERDFARSGFAAVGRAFADLLDGEAFARICGEMLQAGERGNIFDLALRQLGIASSQSRIAEMVATYREHRPNIALCDDAERFLAQLGAVPTGLISDGPGTTQAAKVDALGLRDRIDHIVLTGEWPEGFGKPHPRAFERIQDLSGFAPADHIYIADNGAKDFLAPNQLGWQTVQILREGRIHSGAAPGPEHAAAHVVSSFDDLRIGTSQDARQGHT